MKILVDASIISKGGGVQVALSFINNISSDPLFELICIVSPQLDEQILDSVKNKIQYYYVETNESIINKFKQGRRIKKLEQMHKPDFVFIVFGPAYWKPSVSSLQGFALGKMLYRKELNIGLVENLFNYIKRFLFQKSGSKFVVETDLVKHKLSSDFGISLDQIFVIGNSYSPNFYQCVMDNKNYLCNSHQDFRILVPGSYYPHKNLEMVLDALAHYILKYGNDVKIIFTIPEDSEDWQNLYNYARNINIHSSIETAGFIVNAEFAKLYLKSDAILCASLVESSTAVFPEAFISEKPLLVSNRPFATELCENAAIYFDPLDVESVAESIKRIRNDSLLRENLVNNGKNILLKNYPSAEQKWALQKKLIIELVNK